MVQKKHPSSGVKITWRRAQVHGLQYQSNTAMKRRLRLNWNVVITCIAPKITEKNLLVSHLQSFWLNKKKILFNVPSSLMFLICKGTNINVSHILEFTVAGTTCFVWDVWKPHLVYIYCSK